MDQRDFFAQQYEAHLHQQESRRWEATLQAGDDNDWTPEEVAQYQLPLTAGSFEDSAAAIQDNDKFWAALATIFTDDQIQAMREELES